MEKLIKNKFIAYCIAIFCMFLWGSAFPTIKLTYKSLNILKGDYFGMIFVAGLRFFIAGLFVLSIMFIFDKKNLKQLIIEFPYLLKLGLLVITFGYLFFYIGTGNTSGMKSSILSSASTFFVIIFSHYLLLEKFNKYKFIAIILGLLGLIIANINKEFNFNFKLNGEVFMLISSILNAFGTIYVKKKGTKISAFASSSGQFMYGGFLLILIGYFGLKQNIIFNLEAIILILYSSLISSLAFSLWYIILKEYDASEISFLRLFIPFFGTFLSSIILKENLTLSILLGLILVILGIIIVNISNKKLKGKFYANR